MLPLKRPPKHDEWIHALEAAAPGASRASRRLMRPLFRRLLMLCDALVIAGARRPGRSVRDHLRVLLAPRSRHFQRPSAALHVLDTVLPGTARAFESAALRYARLPLEGGALTVLDHGTGDTVYTLETRRGPVICKVQRASLGRPLHELVALAAHRRRGYEAVLRHYEGLGDVFPPAHFLVVQGPLFGSPVVLSLQEYVGGRSVDLLHGLDDAALARLLAADPRLRGQVSRFIERTLEAWDDGEWIVDLGKGNLLLVERPTGRRLVYLDVQMKQVARLRTSLHEAVYQPSIDRMRRVLQLAESPSGRIDARSGTNRSTRKDGSR